MDFKRVWSIYGYEKQNGTVDGLAGVISMVGVECRSFDANYVAPKPKALDPQPEGFDETVYEPVLPQPFGVCRVQVTLPAPDPHEFAAIDKVTDEAMLAWARDAQGGVLFAQYQANADADLLNKVNPAATFVSKD